jgi:hypothetical protein
LHRVNRRNQHNEYNNESRLFVLWVRIRRLHGELVKVKEQIYPLRVVVSFIWTDATTRQFV